MYYFFLMPLKGFFPMSVVIHLTLFQTESSHVAKSSWPQPHCTYNLGGWLTGTLAEWLEKKVSEAQQITNPFHAESNKVSPESIKKSFLHLCFGEERVKFSY